MYMYAFQLGTNFLLCENINFILFSQDYVYPDARDRQFLNFFHRLARNNKFDVEKYVINQYRIYCGHGTLKCWLYTHDTHISVTL